MFEASAGADAANGLVVRALRWLLPMLFVAAATAGLAQVWDAQAMAHGLAWLLIGFVVLPCAFALALGVASVALAVLLAVLSAPHWLRGRPTGLGDVLADLWRLAGSVLPGFWRALRRVDRPWLWGALLGYAVGVLWHAVVFGLEGAP